jgi:hypothetical protein
MVGKTEIIDIRVGSTDFDIVADIKKGLEPQDGGEKRLPTLLLYDEVSSAHIPYYSTLMRKAGLRLFEEITYLDEYVCSV